MWLNKISASSAISPTRFSPNTIAAFYHEFSEEMVAKIEDCENQIGGEGICVQIDECKLGKCKYHRGHRVDGVWVEDTPQKRLYLRVIIKCA